MTPSEMPLSVVVTWVEGHGRWLLASDTAVRGDTGI